MLRIKQLFIPLSLGLAMAFALCALASEAAPGHPQLHPARNSHSASVTTTISITYDEPISPLTVSPQTFAVHAMQTGQLTQTYGVNGGTITVTPTRPFHPGELVQVSATTATLGMFGGQPISSTVWQFRAAVQGGIGHFGYRANDTFGLDGSDVALGDVDRDTDLDAVVVQHTAPSEVWLNDGSGDLHSSAHDVFGSDGIGVALGDMDGDGDLDAVIAKDTTPNELWLNDGSGDFGPPVHDAFGSGGTGVALGDLDGDGDLDAVVTDYLVSSEVWLNDGSGGFESSAHDTFGSGGVGVVLGDVDADGDLDVVVFGYDQEVWLNDGSGEFGAAPDDTFDNSTCPARLALGDLDGDGDLDAVVARTCGIAIRVWLNDGSGDFGPSAHDVFGSEYSAEIALGDVDGDGDLDIVVCGHTTTTQGAWLNGGDGRFGSRAYTRFGTSNSTSVALGDVDADGDLDAVVIKGNYDPQPHEVWLNQLWRVHLPLVARGAP